MNKNSQFHLSLESDLLNSLREEAERGDKSVSELIRWILKSFIKKEIAVTQGAEPTSSNKNFTNIEKTLNEINSKLGNFMKRGKN